MKSNVISWNYWNQNTSPLYSWRPWGNWRWYLIIYDRILSIASTLKKMIIVIILRRGHTGIVPCAKSVFFSCLIHRLVVSIESYLYGKIKRGSPYNYNGVLLCRSLFVWSFQSHAYYQWFMRAPHEPLILHIYTTMYMLKWVYSDLLLKHSHTIKLLIKPIRAEIWVNILSR